MHLFNIRGAYITCYAQLYNSKLVMLSSQSYEIFVSHNGSQKPWVKQLVKYLRNSGVSVFFDEDSIKPGENIVTAIENGLKFSKHVLLILSPQAISSKWVALEWSIGLYTDPDAALRYIIPVLLEDCEIPLSLSRLKYLDARDEDIQKTTIQILKAIDHEIKSKKPEKKSEKLKEQEVDMDTVFINENFWPNVPVPYDSKFYVERKVDQDLWNLIQKGPGLACIWGPRRVGKTTLLMKMLKKAQKNKITTVHINCQIYSSDPLDHLLTEICSAISPRITYSSLRNPNSSLHSPKLLLREILRNSNSPLIIGLDETDCISRSGQVMTFFEILRSIYEDSFNKPNKVFFIISSFSSPRDFIKDTNSSPFNLGNSFKLLNFTYMESKLLLQNVNAAPTDEEIKTIWKFTGGQPYLMNQVGYFLNEGISVSEALEKTEDVAFDFFYHSIHYLLENNKNAKKMLQRILLNKGLNELEGLEFIDKGILVKEGDGLKFASGCYENIIRKYYCQ